jgi:hypothetical protein
MQIKCKRCSEVVVQRCRGRDGAGAEVVQRCRCIGSLVQRFIARCRGRGAGA